MAETPAIDISIYQGKINAAAVPQEIVMMKLGGGDDGLYFDPNLTVNYAAVTEVGKAVGLYWFAGGGDVMAEAEKFLAGARPFAEGDVYALDVERGSWNPETDPNAVAWVLAWVMRVHEVTGAWPLVYMNISTANAHDWSAVFANCGFWCAAPSYGWDDALPVKYTVIIQQGGTAQIAGIPDNVTDTDMFFGTKEQFLSYAYKTPQPVTVPDPAPAPVPQPTVPPVPETPPVAPVEQPVVAPTPAPDVPQSPPPQSPVPVATGPVVTSTPPAKVSLFKKFIHWLRWFLAIDNKYKEK